MNQESKSKYLHFIVRHKQYEQTIGYGHFMDHVRSELNRQNPTSAKALLEQTALLMLNPEDNASLAPLFEEQKKNNAVFANCLPETLRGHVTDTEGPKTIFGGAAEPEFGLSCPRKFSHLNTHGFDVNYVKNDKTHSEKVHGYLLTTDILYENGQQYRGYFDALAMNHGLRAESIPSDFTLQFDYNIPGTTEKLPLMKIASPKNLEADIRTRYKGNPEIIEDYIVGPQSGSHAMNGLGERVSVPAMYKKKLMFFHPACDAVYFGKLSQCIDPLLQTINTPVAAADKGLAPPPEKLDALITLYWLVAQSTPVVRGGSAYANVILQHLGDKLQEQGYKFEIPYTKEGIDLWAQAATLPLKKFTAKFKQPDLFFDGHAQESTLEDYLHQQLQRPSDRSSFGSAFNQGRLGNTPISR